MHSTKHELNLSTLNSINAPGVVNLKMGESLALSLIYYAKGNNQFAIYFRKILADVWPLKHEILFPEIKEPIYLGHIEPLSFESAQLRANWLVANLENREIAGGASTALHMWIKKDDLPKAIVIGVVGVAIPGITLGLIKRRVGPMVCIVSTDSILKPKKLPCLVASATCGVLSHAIQTVEGNKNMMDPDLYDWLFGPKEVSLYKGDQAPIRNLYNELKNMGVASYIVCENDKVLALAMSPIVSGYNINRQASKFEKIEDTVV